MRKPIKPIIFIVLFSLFLTIFLFSTSASGEFYYPETLFDKEIIPVESQFTQFSGDLDIVIIGVTLVPHIASGEIASFSDCEFSKNPSLGGLLHIFIKNNSLNEIEPIVKFNGKTVQELINEGVLAWANTPDTRNTEKTSDYAAPLPISTGIPHDNIDVYTLNTIDGNFFYSDINIHMLDLNTNLSAEGILHLGVSDVNVTRLSFTSSNNKIADNLHFFIENKSNEDIIINSIRLYDATSNYNEHYWETYNDYINIDFFNDDGVIPSKDTGGGSVSLTSLPFGEIIVGIQITIRENEIYLFNKIKPLVINTVINSGWSEQDLYSENFQKTFKSMHFNNYVGGNLAHPILNDPDYKVYLTSLFYNVEEYSLDEKEKMHLAERFGEPQHSYMPPENIFRYFLRFRNSSYPTGFDLTHEPYFYYFSGLADYVDFDAYRISAPAADVFTAYKENYNAKATNGWGAPLETLGHYMRTLNSLSMPSPTAAWTQGAHTWFTPPTNKYEKRIQAYQIIANGATSLYWFNININSLSHNIKNAEVIRLVNREIATIDKFLPITQPYFYKNVNNYDINTSIGDDFALLFASDLNYHKFLHEYRYKGARNVSLTFNIPSYLNNSTEVMKITFEGVEKLDNAKYSITNNKVTIEDKVNETAIYFVTSNPLHFDYLTSRYNSLIQVEESQNFDIFNDKNDFAKFKEEKYSNQSDFELFAYGKSFDDIITNLDRNAGNIKMFLVTRRMLLTLKVFGAFILSLLCSKIIIFSVNRLIRKKKKEAF